MQVKDSMTKNIIYFSPDETIGAAYTTMKHFKIRHLPIVRDGKLMGIISDRDVLKEMQNYKDINVIPQKRLVEIMNTQVVTCDIDSSLAIAAELMLEQSIDCLPILDGQEQLLGIITSTDILRVVANHKDFLEEKMPFTWKLISSHEATHCAM